MKYLLFTSILLLCACDASPPATMKIAAPQREALEKAKQIDRMVQQSAEQMRQNIDEMDK